MSSSPTIQVSPDVLRAKAAEVRKYKSQHDEVITRLRTLVNGLNETWKGDAQTAFINSFESMRGTFKNFSEMLESYAKRMDAAANQLQEIDASLAKSFK